jgi:hypothetical protein
LWPSRGAGGREDDEEEVKMEAPERMDEIAAALHARAASAAAPYGDETASFVAVASADGRRGEEGEEEARVQSREDDDGEGGVVGVSRVVKKEEEGGVKIKAEREY